MTQRIKIDGDQIKRLHEFLDARLGETDTDTDDLTITRAFWLTVSDRDDLAAFLHTYKLQGFSSDREVHEHVAAILRRRTQLRRHGWRRLQAGKASGG